MALIINPSASMDAELLSSCDAVLKYYAASTVLVEAEIVAPTPGYKMYRKRQALAQKLLSGDATAEIKSFAILANNNSDFSSVRFQAETNGMQVYRFLLSDNPTTASAAAAAAQTAVWVSGAVGRSLFDNLAGVTAEDLL